MAPLLPALPEAVLFDLDGTLVDTAPEFVAVIQDMRRAKGLEPLEESVIRNKVTNGADTMVALITDEAVDSPAYAATREQFLSQYEQALGTSARIYPGLREMIANLGQRGVKWGVVTNKRRRFAEPLMAAMALQPANYALVTPCDVQRPKPHPEAIELACRQLGVAATSSVYIGDHQRDIDAGRAAGCVTVAAAYGYLEPGESADRWQADAVVASSNSLAALIMDIAK